MKKMGVLEYLKVAIMVIMKNEKKKNSASFPVLLRVLKVKYFSHIQISLVDFINNNMRNSSQAVLHTSQQGS